MSARTALRSWLSTDRTSPARRPRTRPPGLAIEPLECRTVPTAMTYTVLNTLDSGSGSFRQAILDANANPGADAIVFTIPGGGVQTIQPLSQLPPITDPVVIDGYTQPGSMKNTNGPGLGDNAVLRIELDGSLAGAGSSGLVVTAGNSTVSGLVINRFDASGILLSTNGDDTIAGNFIGTNPAGLIAAGNGQDGVAISTANNNKIGGMSPDARNVISGNLGTGIDLQPSSGNVVLGNFIGTDVTGKIALSTAAGFRSGVFIFGGNNNTIGGTTPAARNLISGNQGFRAGVEINTIGVGNNQVLGNYIGTDVTGCFAVPNGTGVDAAAGPSSTPTLVGGNLISGNSNTGVYLIHGVARGNLIGTDVNGTKAVANGRGVFLNSDSILGGTTPGAHNVVSGNTNEGVFVANGGNTVQGNYIGTDITGMAPLGNAGGGGGVYLVSGNNDLIGGSTPGAGNVIANNSYRDVFVSGSSGKVTIQGNYIGTDKTGTVPMGDPNSGYAVHLDHASNVTLGGTASSAGNVIGGRRTGVGINGADSFNNVVQGNSIGVGADGVTPVSNGYGVYLTGGAFGNMIGGTAAGAGNMIADNRWAGVLLDQAGLPAPTGNPILGNRICNTSPGYDDPLVLGIDLNRTPSGQGVDGPNPNDIGDADTGCNGLQNYPYLSSVANGLGTTTVAGSLNSTPNSMFRVEFFANSTVKANGYSEGEIYLGFATVTTDAGGNVSFSVPLSSGSTAGKYLTATATNLATGDTSEFSKAVVVRPLPTAAVTGPSVGVRGQPLSFTLTAAGSVGPYTFCVDWDGNGTVDQTVTGPSGTTLPHAYIDTGSYTVRVTAADGDGFTSPVASAAVAIQVALLEPDPICPGQQSLFVGGTTGDDHIVISPAAGGAVQVQANGMSVGAFAPTGRVVVYAQAGDDDVQVAGGITLPAWLYGGDGNDRLKGGSGTNVLTGGGGDDLLVGGNNRDVLIGGAGADRLVGNAEDDILDAGLTVFDTDESALSALLCAWTDTGRTYQQRVDAIALTGVGPGNAVRLNVSTVFDDGAADVLTGTSGSDWFFANVAGGGVKDKITDLSASEFFTDLEFIYGP
ncbi:MAG: hypothetical protein U0871_27135 [Gemmataceae bacterium]